MDQAYRQATTAAPALARTARTVSATTVNGLRISIVAVGRLARSPETELVKLYVERATNAGLRTQLRSAIKKVQKAIAAGDAKAAEAALRAEQPTIDAIADKKIIHKNKAARHKSRLAQQVKALAGRGA